MSKKQFQLIFTGVILMIILSLALQYVFSSCTLGFGAAGVSFFLSVFCLLCLKNSLTPSESLDARNSVKVRYERKGQLKEYQRFCQLLLLFVSGVGVVNFVIGVVETVAFYIAATMVP